MERSRHKRKERTERMRLMTLVSIVIIFSFVCIKCRVRRRTYHRSRRSIRAGGTGQTLFSLHRTTQNQTKATAEIL